MHIFSGTATVSGRIVQSGIDLVPLALHTITSVALESDGRLLELRP
jgi:hypothetical protein